MHLQFTILSFIAFLLCSLVTSSSAKQSPTQRNRQVPSNPVPVAAKPPVKPPARPTGPVPSPRRNNVPSNVQSAIKSKLNSKPNSKLNSKSPTLPSVTRSNRNKSIPEKKASPTTFDRKGPASGKKTSLAGPNRKSSTFEDRIKKKRTSPTSSGRLKPNKASLGKNKVGEAPVASHGSPVRPRNTLSRSTDSTAKGGVLGSVKDKIGNLFGRRKEDQSAGNTGGGSGSGSGSGSGGGGRTEVNGQGQGQTRPPTPQSSTQQQQQQQQQSGQPGSSQTSSSSISNLHSLIGYSNPPAPPGTNRPRPEAVHQDTNGGKHAEVAGILQQHMRPMGDRIPTDSQASHIGHNELAPGPVGSRPPRPTNGGTSGTSGNGAGAGAGASAGVGAGSANVGGTGAVGSTGTAGGSQGSG